MERTQDISDEGARAPAVTPDRRWRAFESLVSARRAVREFSAEPVAQRDVEDVLDAAILAPTSANLQPFELCWVRSAEAKDALVRACMSQSAARTAAELVVCIARWDHCDEARRELTTWLRSQHDVPRSIKFYYDHLARFAYDLGPLGLAGRARRMLARPIGAAVPIPRGPSSREDVRVWAVKSGALVCENLMLAASAKGLDTCPMEGADAVRVGRIVGLCASEWKRSWDLLMVVGIGHRAPDAHVGERWRRAREHLVRTI